MPSSFPVAEGGPQDESDRRNNHDGYYADCPQSDHGVNRVILGERSHSRHCTRVFVQTTFGSRVFVQGWVFVQSRRGRLCLNTPCLPQKSAVCPKSRNRFGQVVRLTAMADRASGKQWDWALLWHEVKPHLLVLAIIVVVCAILIWLAPEQAPESEAVAMGRRPLARMTA